jgi:hypothetical protein
MESDLLKLLNGTPPNSDFKDTGYVLHEVNCAVAKGSGEGESVWPHDCDCDGSAVLDRIKEVLRHAEG